MIFKQKWTKSSIKRLMKKVKRHRHNQQTDR